MNLMQQEHAPEAAIYLKQLRIESVNGTNINAPLQVQTVDVVQKDVAFR